MCLEENTMCNKLWCTAEYPEVLQPVFVKTHLVVSVRVMVRLRVKFRVKVKLGVRVSLWLG